MDSDPDPGGPKTCGSGGSGSGTLIKSILFSFGNKIVKKQNAAEMLIFVICLELYDLFTCVSEILYFSKHILQQPQINLFHIFLLFVLCKYILCTHVDTHIMANILFVER
jgi:hypothetical protein